MSLLSDIADAVAEGINKAGTHTAEAAAKANGISQASQNAAGAFNQQSANIANNLGDSRTISQYGYNSAQAQIANDFTQNSWNMAAAYNEAMWEKAARWNEMMWQKQADFNSAEAQKQRDWQKMMSETSYQRAVTDMNAAGLNPILATGGVGASAGGSGSAASIGTGSMSPASMGASSGQMASGGLLNGVSASENSFTGQMEYMAGTLGLLSTAFDGITSAMKAFGQVGKSGEDIGKDIVGTLESYLNNNKTTGKDILKGAKDFYQNYTVPGRINKWAEDKVKKYIGK